MQQSSDISLFYGFKIPIMSCQVTKLNHAKNHQDFADKDMPAHIITIPEIADAVQENSDIGKSASVVAMLNSSAE